MEAPILVPIDVDDISVMTLDTTLSIGPLSATSSVSITDTSFAALVTNGASATDTDTVTDSTLALVQNYG